MRTDLGDDPAVVSMAATLEINEDEVVGKLHKLWSWADRHTKSGTIVGLPPRWVDRFLSQQGWVTAMEGVGWLDTSDGNLTFPDFTKHNGDSAKKRAEATKRKQKSRSKDIVSQETRDNPVTKTRPEKRREEKRRGTEETEPLSSLESSEPVDQLLKIYLNYKPTNGHPLRGLNLSEAQNATSRLEDLVEYCGLDRAKELLHEQFKSAPRPTTVKQAAHLCQKQAEEEKGSSNGKGWAEPIEKYTPPE